MIFNQITHKNLRDLFCDAVTKVFGDSTTFLDFLEDERYSDKYDCFLDSSGENYIINRETGEYINWYKLTHIGRSIVISTCHMDIPKWFEDFLVEFKESEDKDDISGNTITVEFKHKVLTKDDIKDVDPEGDIFKIAGEELKQAMALVKEDQEVRDKE